MNKIKFIDFLKTVTKHNPLSEIFFKLQNHPTFHAEEIFVNSERGRECFVGLAILLVYVVNHPLPKLSQYF